MIEKTYTTFQIAAICGVKPTTIIQWVKQGKIQAYVTPGKHRRILESNLKRFLTEYKFPIPPDFGGNAKKVLIVEEDAALGKGIEKALKENAGGDIQVEWVQDGVEALLLLGQKAIDLIILDVNTPVVDGSRVLATLKADEKTRDIKVIGMAGKRLAPAKLKFMKAHTDAFFFKPIQAREVAEKTMNLLKLSKPLVKRAP